MNQTDPGHAQSEIRGLQRMVVECISGASPLAPLRERVAGLLMDDMRSGKFQEWTADLRSLGKVEVAFHAFESIAPDDALHLVDLRIRGHLATVQLMIGYHHYPDGEWKVWTAALIREVEPAELPALLC